MSLNPCLIKESFASVEPIADKAVAFFYGWLFVQTPGLRGLFPPAMDVQRDRLFRALTRLVWSIDSPGTLEPFLRQLGRDHRKFGVAAEHYTSVGKALVATVKRFTKEPWTAELEAAWVEAYTIAANLMIEGAEDEKTPPWWLAKVIEHDPRTPDIAVITLRLNEPLPYTAGQFVTVQTARWPRVWRTYSIANAPRGDRDVVRLHVRTVPAGWVSTTLTSFTRIDDVLLLGPAVGTMGPPEDGDRPLLFVAGGTGLAPIKAIIEHIIDSGRRPDMHLLFGARTARELYDLPDLVHMESGFPWLRVYPVVSGERGFDGMRGALPEIVERFHSWAGHEAYVCGPPAMVTATVRRLQRMGMPLTRIHRDAVDPL